MLTEFLLNGPLVAEHLHAVDEVADAVRFVGDELRQRPVLFRGADFEELRGAPDARKRVLDFVGEHRRHGRHRARGAAMGELPLDHGGHAALLDHEEDMIAVLGERRGEDIDRAMRLVGKDQIEFVLVNGAARHPHLICEGGKRIGAGEDGMQCPLFKQCLAYIEKDLGGKIRENDAIGAIDNENDVRKALHERLEIERSRSVGQQFPLRSFARTHRVEQSGFIQ